MRIDGKRMTKHKTIRYVFNEHIGCYRPMNLAKSVDVSLSNSIEPIIFPVS